MATITLRSVKGAALTHTEMDNNFTNLNSDKAELSGDTFTGAMTFSAGIIMGGVTVTSFASSDDVLDNFPAGTIMAFQQTTAPTGWTKESTHDNKGLRVVTGTASSGGSDSWTTTFSSSKTTQSHTLSVSEIPSHNHTIRGTQQDGGSKTNYIDTSGTNGNQHNTSSTTTSTGGGGGHSHDITMDLEYVDIILAAKD